MKTTRMISAALAAVMAVGVAAGGSAVAGCADSDVTDAAVLADGGNDSSEEYEDVPYSDDEYEKNALYEKYIKAGYKVSKKGIVYKPVYSYEPDGTNDTGSGICFLVDYLGYGEDLVIPTLLDGLVVDGFQCSEETAYPQYGFNDLDQIRTLTIEAPLREINNCFNNCPNLEKVVLPDTVKRFQVDYDDSTCAAFSNCPKLREINIPKSLSYVDGTVLENTPWLEEREKKDGLVIVGDGVLLSGRKAKGRVVVPKKVKSIAGYAFMNNTGMTEIVLTNGLKNTADYGYGFAFDVFQNTLGLKKITLQNGLTRMPMVDAVACPNLEKVILPPSISKECAESIFFDFEYTRPTYYYYKGTPVDKVLHRKGISKKIKKALLPGKTGSFKAAAKSKSVKAAWKKVASASGYQVQISTVKTFKKGTRTKLIKDNGKTACTFKKLKSKKKYYIRMRTYKVLGGKRYYGNYTKVKSFTAK